MGWQLELLAGDTCFVCVWARIVALVEGSGWCCSPAVSAQESRWRGDEIRATSWAFLHSCGHPPGCDGHLEKHSWGWLQACLRPLLLKKYAEAVLSWSQHVQRSGREKTCKLRALPPVQAKLASYCSGKQQAWHTEFHSHTALEARKDNSALVLSKFSKEAIWQ